MTKVIGTSFITWIIITAVFSISLNAAPIKASAGLDLGGNGTILTSDPSLQAFGLGAGYQGSLIYSMWDDQPIGGKFRLESLSLNENAIQKTHTDFLVPGSSLHALSQSWTLMSVGAEGHFNAQGQSFFWEALLGYAIGKPATVTVTMGAADTPLIDTSQTTSSGFCISGGIGLKKTFSKYVIGMMSLRTFFLFASPYNSNAMANKAFIPIPLIFNLGAEYPFDL